MLLWVGTQAAVTAHVERRGSQVAPLLRPYVSRLKASEIPVYLPSWLPRASKHVYISVSGGTYTVGIYVPGYQQKGPGECLQCMLFFIRGQREKSPPSSGLEVSPGTRPILMQSGKGFTRGAWGYLGPCLCADHKFNFDFIRGPWKPVVKNPAAVVEWHLYYVSDYRAPRRDVIRLATSFAGPVS